ncbi:MAG: tRNA pseudouridine(55) synthase TruB [Clostridia bacterium]|jgi:tRNA pseudouridine55 synthase|nr:tRNA pseudouridine(55) synthase TruB [Clostridia bacterium]MDH7572377.1 tRNA pseudouridine(55) synthase TruB [Clostridia bacterium]
MDGFLCVLKPPGMTSHDLVAEVRRLTGQRRVGHAGTLDPDAAGVLPMGLGKATRLLEFARDEPKAYRCQMILGLTTTTQDLSGAVLERRPVGDLTPGQVREVLREFEGEYRQLPPMFSARHHRGRRLYEWAREGIEVERRPHPVYIYGIRLLDLRREQGRWGVLLDVSCSSGTYIRTLCADIGTRLGCGGCLAFLIRTRVGPFRLEASLTREELADAGREGINRTFLLPPDFVLQSLPQARVPPAVLRPVLNGNPVPVTTVEWAGKGVAEEGRPVRLYAPDGRLVAVGRVEGSRINMLKVLGWEEK